MDGTEVEWIHANEAYPKKQLECDGENSSLPFSTLAGESVAYLGHTSDSVIALSDYRFFYINEDSVFNMPLGIIDQVECQDMFTLNIFCKDARTLRCVFSTPEECRRWHKRLLAALLPPNKLEDLFAFAFFLWCKDEQFDDLFQQLKPHKECSVFWSLENEVERMGFDTKNFWKISSVNNNYKLCQSYPRSLLVPSSVSDNDLEKASGFRYLGRIPVVVWRHQQHGTVIARSSQPQVGWFGWNDIYDENLIQAVADASFMDCGIDNFDSPKFDMYSLKSDTGPDSSLFSTEHSSKLPFHRQKLLILDARSYTAAVANRAKGGGCESAERYPNCEIQFMSLANIHSIRKSFQAIRVLCASAAECQNWLSSLENTKWLHHISGLIKAALRVVEAVDQERRPVLIHCSDGWDRTSQIVALAELMLDSYYRTMEGFQVLVEREWCDFGHKFADRCGHRPGNNDPNERCPVFLQWVDCVFQLLQQFPCSFEFNKQYLIKLVIHTYSCLFGTFFCNNGQEREQQRVQERTFSVWAYLHALPIFRNNLFKPGKQILRPSSHIKDIVFWAQLYMPPVLSPQNNQTSHKVKRIPQKTSGNLLVKTHSCDTISAIDHHSKLHRHLSDPLIDRINKFSIKLHSGNTKVEPEVSFPDNNFLGTFESSSPEKPDSPELNDSDTEGKAVYDPSSQSHASVDDSTDTLVSEHSATPMENGIGNHLEDTHNTCSTETLTKINSENNIIDNLTNPTLTECRIKSCHPSVTAMIKFQSKVNNGVSAVLKQCTYCGKGNNHLRHHSRTPSSGFPATPCEDHSCESIVSCSYIIPPHRLDLDGLIILRDEIQESLCQILTLHQAEVDSLHRELYLAQLELCQQVCHNCKIKDGQYGPSDDAASLPDSVCSGELLESSAGSSDVSWEHVDVNDSERTLWIPDHAVAFCMGCGAKFWAGKRKHHCRKCGRVFCAHCSNQMMPVPSEQLFYPVRVCCSCYSNLQTIIHSNLPESGENIT